MHDDGSPPPPPIPCCPLLHLSSPCPLTPCTIIGIIFLDDHHTTRSLLLVLIVIVINIIPTITVTTSTILVDQASKDEPEAPASNGSPKDKSNGSPKAEAKGSSSPTSAKEADAPKKKVYSKVNCLVPGNGRPYIYISIFLREQIENSLSFFRAC